MGNFKFSLERGSLFRIIIGVVITLVLSISAVMNPDNMYKYLFFVFIGLAGISREYSLFLLNKKENTDLNSEE